MTPKLSIEITRASEKVYAMCADGSALVCADGDTLKDVIGHLREALGYAEQLVVSIAKRDSRSSG